MKVFLLLVPLFAGSRQAAVPLIGPSAHDASEEDFHPCHEDDALSCEVVTVDFDALQSDEISLPDGHVLQKHNVDEIMDGVHSYTFTGVDGSEATFTSVDGKAFGNANLMNGSDWVLEDCNNFPGCHVWKEEDMDLTAPGDTRDAAMSRANWNALLAQGESDKTTISTYSVKFYYTRDFAAITDDIPLYVAQVVAETNQGYINSKIPVRMVAHCIEAAPLNDNPSGSAMIGEFRRMKGTMEALRGSADHAALLVKKYNICGNAYLRGWNGLSVSTEAKGCALGYYTMGHEVGHSQGAMHNKVDAPNTWRSYGLGFHVLPSGLDGRGYRTIMAYNLAGHGRKINYWSAKDSSVQFRNQYPTGDAEADNQRLLTETRFAFAAIGDESEACTTGSVVTAGPPTTAAPTTPAPTCAGDGSSICWAHCSDSAPCGNGHGDCDRDSHCQAGLVCGKDNCAALHPGAEAAADCCVEAPTTAPPTNGTGGTSDWAFCSSSNLCFEGQGDCDSDSHCQPGLMCGKDNCRDFHPTAHKAADCCMVDISTTTPAPVGGTGSSTDWAFCSKSSPCSEGQGDCDRDNHCQGNLVCGKDNCRDWHPNAEKRADCCTLPAGR